MAIYVNRKLVAGFGSTGLGIPSGGTVGQVLIKKTDTDYDVQWVDLPNNDKLENDNIATDEEVCEMLDEIFIKSK